jgi:MFS transporter, OFA family, oxalate/formate antiporter
MRKYTILIAAVAMQLCLGANYAWSTFVPALKTGYGFTTAQTQTVFGTISLVLTILLFFGGRIQDRLGPRIPSFIGGIIFGASYILAGFSSGTFPALLSLVGIMSGFGVGLCYMSPIACSVKWFPRHKSLVTGIAVAGFGGSAIVISRVGEYLLARNMDVLDIFKYLGAAYLIVVCLSSLALKNPGQSDDQPQNTTKIRTLDLLRDRHFLGLLCGFFPSLCVGLMTIGNIKPFGLSLGLSAAVAGAAVGVLGFFNALGRISWGLIGHYAGGKRTIVISLASTSIVCLAAPLIVPNNIFFLTFAVLAGFNYGACLVLYATEIANHYGTESLGTVYSTLFLSNGVAGFCAPSLAGKLFDTIGSYTPAFLIFGCIAMAGTFLFYFVYQPVKR